MPVTTEVRNNLVKLTAGLFDAAPGASNLALLMAEAEAGSTVHQIGVNLADTVLFKSLYPDTLSSATFIEQFLANVLGGEVSAASLAWAQGWMLEMLAGGMSRGEMLMTALIALNEVPATNTEWATAKASLDNKAEVALHYSLNDQQQSAPPLANLQAVLNAVTSDPSTVVEAIAQIDENQAPPPQPQPEPEPQPEPQPQGATFTLTAGIDQGSSFAGTSGDDTYNAIYDAQVTDTLNIGDVLAGGGGIDTLNVAHLIDVAITPPDALWAGLGGIEKLVLTTTGNGAQTITSGTDFQAAFGTSGIDFVTTTSGSGAINIGLSTFTGLATLTTTSLAGAQAIHTGVAATTVNATSTGGALHIEGAGLVSVTATTTGGGAQTIISTSTSAVTVIATTGEGALNVTTGSGNDTITLFSSNVAGANLLIPNAGADTITLVSGVFAAPEIIVIGNGDSGITLATADSIKNFVSGSDQLKMGFAGDATGGSGNYVESTTAVADFATALTAANVALATLNGTSGATELFAFQFDGSNGYLFNDTDSNGAADQVIVLVGLTAATFAATDIII